METLAPKAQSAVSVIVVSFNTAAQLSQCLASIERHHEVIVVDNASTDGSPEMVERDFPHIHLIRNRSNEGFGAANNRGVAHATRPLTLFLNSDCYPEPGAIDELARHLSDGVCAVGGRLLNPDRTLQESAANMLGLSHVFCEQFGLEGVVKGYWATPPLQETTVHPVGQVMGACLMIRRGAMVFDERYFLYCEDTDLLYRLVKETGDAVLYVPSAVFVHELGASSAGPGRWRSVARYNRGKELYFKLHFGSFASLACWIMNRTGALLRLAIWSLAAIVTLFQKKSWADRIPLWAAVLTAPLAGPSLPARNDP